MPWFDLSSGSASPLTTKGDVWGYSTVDARIPVGSDGQVLTADSALPLGVKWSTPSGGGGCGCELLMQDGVTAPPVPLENEAQDDWLYEDCDCEGSGSSEVPSLALVHYTGANDQAIPDQTLTALEFDAEDYDSDGYWSAGNPTRLTVPTNGVYRLSATTRMDGEATFDTSAGNFRAFRFRVNGSASNADFYGDDFRRAMTVTDSGHETQAVAVLDAGDYVEVTMYQNSGETLNIPGDATLFARFSIERIVDLS